MVKATGHGLHVVIVEDRAELPFGHYSTLCADLAAAFAGLDHEVELLTTRGWAGEWDGRPRDASFTVVRYGAAGLPRRSAQRSVSLRSNGAMATHAGVVQW